MKRNVLSAIVTISLLLSVPSVQSATIQIYGTVTDTTGTLTLADATVMCIAEDDTATVTTASDGTYSTQINVSMNHTGVQGDTAPQTFRLRQNYPNPFNPSTVIPFDMTQPGQASLTIYSVTGQQVKTLANGYFSAGAHTIVWDGCDNSGRSVSSGVYLYRLLVNRIQDVRKMVLLDSAIAPSHAGAGFTSVAKPALNGNVKVIIDKPGYETYYADNLVVSEDQSELQLNVGLTIHDFFPLAVGNTWVYQEIDDSNTFTVTITAEVLIDGMNYYQVEPYFFGLPFHCSSPAFLRKNEYGDLLIRHGEEEFVALPFSTTTLSADGINENPCSEFNYYLTGIGDQIIDMGLIPCEIITPAGTFYDNSTFYISETNVRDRDLSASFVPGVGLVRRRHLAWGGGWLLESAIVNGVHYP